MLTAEVVYQASREQRKLLIESQANLEQMDSGIVKAQKLSSVLNPFLIEYFNIKLAADKKSVSGSILLPHNLNQAFLDEIEKFKPIAIAELKQSLPTSDELIKSSKNIYEMTGAVRLSYANKVTRNLSTTMGLLWERLANISPYAINPEIEFNIKIKGIDLIALNSSTNLIEYQQLKTQHNTLTGSQKSRSVEELSIHENPVFCACFANKGSWTFKHPDIPRFSGEDFWSRIGISYEIFFNQAKILINDLENEYMEIIATL